MRVHVTLVLLAACSKTAPSKTHDAAPRRAPPDARVIDAEPAGLAPHRTAKDLATAWRELVGDDVRAVGVGELHTRIDKAAHATSAIARFRDDVLPAVATRASDLVVETWVPDPKDKTCGKQAAKATAKVEAAVERPKAAMDELGTMVQAAREDGIQPHAMKITCADWTKIAPPDQDLDLAEMLTAITRELGGIASTALAARAKQPSPRTLVLTYGGALHNDLYPNEGVADWAFGPRLDAATAEHYVEIDLIVPEYAEVDQAMAAEPWYPLLPLASPEHVVIVEKGPRAYAVLLPRTR